MQDLSIIGVKVWRSAVIFLLLGLGAFELFEATRFFLVTYPELELALAQHAVNTHDVQTLTAGAVASSLMSGLNMFFAVRLFRAHERLVHFLELIGSSGLVVWHERVIEWLSSFNYVAIWERLW